MPDNLAAVQAVFFALLLCAASVFDLRRRIIPDTLNLAIAASALLCFSQQGACFVDYSFVFSVSGASSAEVFFVLGWGSSFTTGIKRLANLFLPRLRT